MEKLFNIQEETLRQQGIVRAGFVMWESPVFGICEGEFVGETLPGFVEVKHPIMKQNALVPCQWIVKP